MFGRKKRADKVIEALDALGRISEKIAETSKKLGIESEPNPLFDLIRKTQTLDELNQLWDKYENSVDPATNLVFIITFLDIKIRGLEKRVSKLERKSGQGDSKTDKSSG